MEKRSEKKMNRVLLEYLKDAKRSDREIAKVIGVSQPTITRMRSRLVTEGYIKNFTVVPDFVKLGYEILAFTFTKLKTYPRTEDALEIVERAQAWVEKRPNVIFAADGEGLGKDIIMMSFHKNYSAYADFMRTYAMDWGDVINGFESFRVSLGSGFKMKPFDLKYLGDAE